MKQYFSKQKIFLFLFSIIFIITSFDSIFAQENKVKLQVPFPGVEEIAVCNKSGDDLQCKGIANYVSIAYQWTLGFAMLLSVLLLTYAGFIWMTAHGSAEQLQKAHGIIRNTFVGLGLAIGSYLLLYAINPNLIKLPSIELGKKVKEIGLDIEHLDDATPHVPVGKGCVSAQPDEILSLIRAGKIGDSGGRFSSQIKNGQGGVRVDPRVLGGIKTVYETCGGGFRISSLIRTGGSGNHAGLAVDLAGNLCGKMHSGTDDPANYCNHPQFKALVEKLVRLGYRVGSWRGKCVTPNNFKECPGPRPCTKATGVHMHIDVNHGACK